MSLPPSSADSPGHNGTLDAVELIARRFEKLWSQQQRPSLDAFLSEAGPARHSVLIELVHAELELRLKTGEAARVEEYLQRYPELAEEPAVEWELIEAEHRLRSRREPGLSLYEYRSRFPRWEEQLKRLAAAPRSQAQTRPEALARESAPAPIEWPVIPGLEVLGELGRGGMGIVYQVRQTALKRLAAVKVLRPGAGAEERSRFRTEAEAAARLKHPHIAQIYEVGEHAGQPYLVLEYVEGGSLAQRRDGSPWPVREAAELVRRLAEAVQYAHSQGVLHRDLTPGNVLLDGAGQPKVSDFGLAKLVLDVDAGPTRTEAVLGTPSYMSPEQASGQSKQVGPAADVYALGAILYELLTARPPFRGESSLDTLRQVLADEPVSPRRLRSTVPPDLETICLKCLQKKPADRYSSAANLAEDLRCFLAGEPIKAKPPSSWRLAVRWSRKQPAATAMLAAGLILIVVVLVGSLWHSAQISQALENIKKEQTRATRNEQWARQIQYASDLRLSYQSFKLGDVFLLDRLLERHPPSGGANEPSDFEWRYLARFRQSAPKGWRAHRSFIRWLAYSPDGQLLATAGDDQGTYRVKVWDAITGKLVSQIAVNQASNLTQSAAFGANADPWLAVFDGNTVTRWNPWTGQALNKPLTHSNRVQLVAVSRDGQRIITGGHTPITIWDATANTPHRCLPDTSKEATFLALAQNGGTLLSFQKGNAAPYKEWDLSTGEFVPINNYGKLFSSPQSTILGGIVGGDNPVLLRDARGRLQENWLPSTLGKVTAAAISFDDRRLALACADGSARFFDLPTRRPHGHLRWQTSEITLLSFSPDGKRIAAATDDGTVYQVDTPPRQEPETLHTVLVANGSMAYSPDGKTLAVADQDRTIKLIDTSNGRVRLVLKGHLNRNDLIAFSSDSRTLATLSKGEVFLWEASTGQRRSLPFKEEGSFLAFSPTQPLLAIGSTTGSIHLLDVGSSSTSAVLRGHTAAITALAFSPDGQTLASTDPDHVANLWNCSSIHVSDKPALSHAMSAPIYSLAFLPDNRTLLTGGADSKAVQFWQVDANSFREVKSPLKHLGPITRLHVSRDGQTLLIQGPSQLPLLYDLKTHSVRHQPLWKGTREGGKYGAVPSPTEDRLAVFDGESATVEIYTIGAWKAEHFAGQRLWPIRSLAFTSDGRSLITGSDVPRREIRSEVSILGWPQTVDSRLLRNAATCLREWNAGDGSERPGLNGPEVMAPPSLIALSPDDRTLAAGGEDGSIFLWERVTGQLRHRLFVSEAARDYTLSVEVGRGVAGVSPQYPESLRALAFGPDSRLLVTASSRGMVTVWDVSKGQEVQRWTVDPQALGWMGFAPNGDLAISQGSQLDFREPQSGQLRLTLGEKEDVSLVSVVFSTDGSLAALADQNRRIRLWDRQTGKEKGQLVGHVDRVNAMAFSPDHKTLASASSDRSVKLWNLAALAETASLEAHSGSVSCVAFDPAGALLVTGGEDASGGGEVFFWHAP